MMVRGMVLAGALLCGAVPLGGCGPVGLTPEERAQIIERGVQLAGDEAHAAALKKATAEGLSQPDAEALALVARKTAELAARVALEKATPPAQEGGSKFGGTLVALVLAVLQGIAGRRRSVEV